MPYKLLQDLLDAYRRTIGEPYRGWEMGDVLKLFDHCARTSQTWQKELCDTTGLSSSKVNRFIDVAEERGWIERSRSRTSDAKKPLQMTATGRQVVAEFERLCRKALEGSAGTARQNTTGKAAPKPARRPRKTRPERERGDFFDFDAAQRQRAEAGHKPK